MEPESWICNKNEYLVRVELRRNVSRKVEVFNITEELEKFASGRDHIKRMTASSKPEQMIDVL